MQLFVERAAASQDTFELSDEDAPAVAELCRGLDGIALAIEIAAGRVDLMPLDYPAIVRDLEQHIRVDVAIAQVSPPDGKGDARDTGMCECSGAQSDSKPRVSSA